MAIENSCYLSRKSFYHLYVEGIEALNELFEKLNDLWNSSEDIRFKGENPACVDVLEEIEEKFQNMTDEAIMNILNNLSEEQLEQITLVLEDMVDDRPFMERYM